MMSAIPMGDGTTTDGAHDASVVELTTGVRGPSPREHPAAATEPHAVSRRERAKASLDERLGRPTPTVWLSGQEAAEYVGVSWPTLRQLILDDAIPHVRLGTRWKIAVDVLDTHLQRRAEIQAGRR